MKLKLKVYKVTFKYKCFTQNKLNQYLSYAIFINITKYMYNLSSHIHCSCTLHILVLHILIHVYLNIQKIASAQFI